jgi:hypothetical protein
VPQPARRSAMTGMDKREFETLTLKLMELKVEHRDLDEVIDQYMLSGQVNDLLLKRLKKRKLQLKDFIARIESRLIPDLNA